MNKLPFGPLWGMRAVWLLVYIDGLAESLHLLKQLTEVSLLYPSDSQLWKPFVACILTEN